MGWLQCMLLRFPKGRFPVIVVGLMLVLWVLVVLGSGFAARRVLAGRPEVPGEIENLMAPEYATLLVAASVVLPRDGPVGAEVDARDVVRRVDRFVGLQTTTNRIAMRLLFHLVEQGTILFPPPGPGGRRRFTDLSADQRLTYLSGWQQSSNPLRRTVFISLRTILTMAFFGEAEVLTDLGLTPARIETPPSEVDALWPPIGRSRSALVRPVEERGNLEVAPESPGGHPGSEPESPGGRSGSAHDSPEGGPQ